MLVGGVLRGLGGSSSHGGVVAENRLFLELKILEYAWFEDFAYFWRSWELVVVLRSFPESAHGCRRSSILPILQQELQRK